MLRDGKSKRAQVLIPYILSGPWGSVYCGLCIVLPLYRLF